MGEKKKNHFLAVLYYIHYSLFKKMNKSLKNYFLTKNKMKNNSFCHFFEETCLLKLA